MIKSERDVIKAERVVECLEWVLNSWWIVSKSVTKSWTSLMMSWRSTIGGSARGKSGSFSGFVNHKLYTFVCRKSFTSVSFRERFLFLGFEPKNLFKGTLKIVEIESTHLLAFSYFCTKNFILKFLIVFPMLKSLIHHWWILKSFS